MEENQVASNVAPENQVAPSNPSEMALVTEEVVADEVVEITDEFAAAEEAGQPELIKAL